MDLVEKNIALTQEHKVLEALMKLRNISKFFWGSKFIANVCMNFVRLVKIKKFEK